MADGTSPLTRCGIDTVEIARVERLLLRTPHEDLLRIFSKEELCDVGEGPGRTARLAARFAAKEACLKLFPRETALGLIGPADFTLARDGYGAPRVVCSPKALELIARHRLTTIAVSLAHDKTSALAVALAEPACPCRIPLPVRSARPRRPARPPGARRTQGAGGSASLSTRPLTRAGAPRARSHTPPPGS
jgi:holo-[acyl-carrier protein] synthase